MKMKVIIIKKCKDGDVNDIINVSSGYATNFLIRNKFALPYNSKTQSILNKKLEKIKLKENKENEVALKLKKMIEQTKLTFYLKSNNMVVHGSITKKQILKELLDKGIKIDSLSIENVKINKLGLTLINVKLSKKITAKLNVEVLDEK